MKKLCKLSFAVAAFSLSGMASAGTEVDFGVNGEVLECIALNSVLNDDVRDTHPEFDGGLTEGTNPGSQVNSVCVVRNNNSLRLVDIASNGNPIDSDALQLNRGNNCKGPSRLMSAGITDDARYVFATYEWVGRDVRSNGGPYAGSFAVAWKIETTGNGDRPSPAGRAEFLGDTVNRKNCEQYMSSGLATVSDMLVITPADDPAGGPGDDFTGGRYLAVGKNADGNLWGTNGENTVGCNASSDCSGPVEPNNGVGGYYLP